MPDLNKRMSQIQNKFSKIQKDLGNLVTEYNDLYRDVNRVYTGERRSSSGGLEDFFRLVQVLRRNRDVVSSLARGASGMRSLDKFKFEEDVQTEHKNKGKKSDAVSRAETANAILQDFAGEINA